jgi:hypothetical protein
LRFAPIVTCAQRLLVIASWVPDVFLRLGQEMHPQRSVHAQFDLAA